MGSSFFPRTLQVTLIGLAACMPLVAGADFMAPPPPPPAPTVTPVSIVSDNASTTVAGPGNTVTLSFTSDGTSLVDPTVTIGGHTATVVAGSSNDWTASVVMTGADTEGVVTFSADVGNSAGIATTTISTTTDGTSVVFDRTAPVIASAGDASADATDSSGTTVTYTIPSASDNFDTTVTVSCAPASGTLFAVGDTTVTCTASDTAGNTAAETTFTVHVTEVAPIPAPSGGGNGPIVGTYGVVNDSTPRPLETPPLPSEPPATTSPDTVASSTDSTTTTAFEIVSVAPTSSTPTRSFVPVPVTSLQTSVSTTSAPTSSAAQTAAAGASGGFDYWLELLLLFLLLFADAWWVLDSYDAQKKY